MSTAEARARYVEYGRVLDAAREYLTEKGQVELTHAYGDMAGGFGIAAWPGRADLMAAWEKFQGQVYRAFNRLAADGECTKVNANRAGPDGNYVSSPRYFTGGAWTIAAEKYRRESERAADEAERFAVVHGRLGALGIFVRAGLPSDLREAPVLRDVHQWERLLDMATDREGRQG